jgi:putative inorganic carbon (hco3(-)) transporter
MISVALPKADSGSALPLKTGLEPALVLFLCIELILVGMWAKFGNILYLPIAILALIVFYQSLQSLLVWVTLVVFGYAVLFLQSSEGVSIVEIGFAVYFYGGLVLWFIDRWFVNRQTINTEPGDMWLMIFLFLALVTIITALVSENSILLWTREFLMLAGFLFYFPVREVMKEQRGRKVVLGAFFLLALIVAAKNLYRYRSGAMIATFMWELLGARQAVNEPLFFAVIVFAVALWMTTTRRWVQMMCLAVIVLFSLSLILTFSRGYWLGTLVGVAVLFLLGKKEERKRLGSLGLIAGVGGVSIVFFVFRQIFYDLMLTIVGRLFTSAVAFEDKSVTNRVAESRAVWDLISKNPIAGAGLGSEISFFHLMRRSTQHTYYMHNAYLYLWFKFGIVGLVVFLTSFGAKIRQGILWLRNVGNEVQRASLMAAVAILVAILEITVTSPQFYARDSILIITLCWALIGSSAPEKGQRGIGY